MIGNQEEAPLADAFLKRKQALAQKYTKPSLPPSEQPKDPKPQKTKEELAQLRKEMMKRKPKPEPKHEDTPPLPDEEQKAACAGSTATGPSARFGQKTPIDKKEMLALTSKNYELLPEVQRKKLADQKKEDFKNRMK